MRDLPLLYDKMGGFLKMGFSKGCFRILSQFSISIFLRLHTDGWYVVTKGKICFRAFVFC